MLHSKLHEIRELRSKIKDITTPGRFQKFTRLERVAIFITKRVGTMGFFIAIVTWSVGWVVWNLYAPANLRFDPFPAFVLWLFISNFIQILLMPLLMVGQNLLNEYAEARAEADFAINKVSEREIELVIEYLEGISNKIEKMEKAEKNQTERIKEVKRKISK
jgi:uncharacterized membrane protein